MKEHMSKYSKILDVAIVVMVLLFGFSLFYPKLLWKREDNLRQQGREDMEIIFQVEKLHYILTNSFTDRPKEAIQLVNSCRDTLRKNPKFAGHAKFIFSPDTVSVKIPQNMESYFNLFQNGSLRDSVNFVFGLTDWIAETQKDSLLKMRKLFREIQQLVAEDLLTCGKKYEMEFVDTAQINIPTNGEKFKAIQSENNDKIMLDYILQIADFQGYSKADTLNKIGQIVDYLEDVFDSIPFGKTIVYNFPTEIIVVNIPEDIETIQKTLADSSETADSCRIALSVGSCKAYSRADSLHKMRGIIKHISQKKIINLAGKISEYKVDEIAIIKVPKDFETEKIEFGSSQDSMQFVFKMANYKAYSAVDSLKKARLVLGHISGLISSIPVGKRVEFLFDSEKPSTYIPSNWKKDLKIVQEVADTQDSLSILFGMTDWHAISSVDSVNKMRTAWEHVNKIIEEDSTTIGGRQKMYLPRNFVAKFDSSFAQLYDTTFVFRYDSLLTDTIFSYSFEMYSDSTWTNTEIMSVDEDSYDRIKTFDIFKREIFSPRTVFYFEMYSDSTRTETDTVEVQKAEYESVINDSFFVEEISGPVKIFTIETFADASREIIKVLDVTSEELADYKTDPLFVKQITSPLKSPKIHRKFFKRYYTPTEKNAFCELPNSNQLFDVRVNDFNLTIKSPFKKYKWRKFGVFVMQDSSFGSIVNGEPSWGETQ